MAGDERDVRSAGVRHRKTGSLDKRGDGWQQEDTKIHVMNIEPGTYWLTRIVMLRFIAFVYSFLVAYHQNIALIGKDGLLPAHLYMDKIKSHTRTINAQTFSHASTLLWLFDYTEHLDILLNALAVVGLLLSGYVMIKGAGNWIIMGTLWVAYHSLVNVGQRWYSFGWESQLLESGFLAIFLCPLWSLKPVPKETPTSRVVIWAYRWLIFRIMIGAGLIKIRGDECWRDLTCMNYHYETQPVPNPISYYLHQTPVAAHKFETLTNHFVELVTPWFMILPRRVRIVGGSIQVLFQVVLIVSGNLSFLNWLTILPSLACFDDRSLQWMFSSKANSAKWAVTQIQTNDKKEKKVTHVHAYHYIRRLFNISLGVLLAYLSIPVVQNLISSQQAMNTSFDPLRIVNTYGAFGSITKERTEIIFQGTYDDPRSTEAKWLEYEFKCKPGNVMRRPCLISPYHYRLDWLMWFAAFQNYQYNNWLVHLAAKLLVNDEKINSLLAHNPFEGKLPPRFLRAEHYKYTFTKVGSKAASNGAWWKRKHLGNYLPVVSLSTLQQYLTNMGWAPARLPA